MLHVLLLEGPEELGEVRLQAKVVTKGKDPLVKLTGMPLRSPALLNRHRSYTHHVSEGEGHRGQRERATHAVILS